MDVIALAIGFAAESTSKDRNRDDREQRRRHVTDDAARQEHRAEQHGKYDRKERGHADDAMRHAIGLAIEVFVSRRLAVVSDRRMNAWIFRHTNC